MKRYFKCLSVFLLFTILCLNFNSYKVKANALAPALVTGVADSVVLKGLISAGVTIPTGAVVVGGVAATTYIVARWKQDNPEKYEAIKTSVVNSATGALNSTISISSDLWDSMKNWVNSRFVKGGTSTTFYLSGTIYSKSLKKVVPISFSNFDGGVKYSVNGVDYVYRNSSLEILSVLGYYIYDGDVILTVRARMLPDGSPYSTEFTTYLPSYEYSYPSGVAPVSFPYSGKDVIGNSTWDWTNNSTKDRSICVPDSLVKLPTTATEDVINTTVTDIMAGLQGKTYADIPLEVPTVLDSNPPVEENPPDTENPPGDNLLQNLWDWLKGILQSILDAILAIPNAIARFFDLTQPINLDPLKVAGDKFTNVFPFSLPWDIYRSFSTLKVSSIKPNFNFDLSNLPISNFGLSRLDVDLTDFNELFTIVRTFELLLFDIALVFATRKLLGGDV